MDVMDVFLPYADRHILAGITYFLVCSRNNNQTIILLKSRKYVIMILIGRYITMIRQITIGNQSFECIVSNNLFYVDKTMFIRDWWKKYEEVTLITRPRSFGKTLAMSMVERFFSVEYKGKPEIFANLDINKDSEMMKKQGEYPVISLSFADVTGSTYEDMIKSLSKVIRNVFSRVSKCLGMDKIEPRDVTYMQMVMKERFDENNEVIPLSENMIKGSLERLSSILSHKYDGKKAIILLDEYDVPLENAYLEGYCDKAAEFFEQFYKNTFKVNGYLERGLIFGITMPPKVSFISPFNNYAGCSVTDPFYGNVFGFTQEEVDDALGEYGLLGLRDEVKRWYGGYQFGRTKGMYNPLSICSLLDSGEFKA